MGETLRFGTMCHSKKFAVQRFEVDQTAGIPFKSNQTQGEASQRSDDVKKDIAPAELYPAQIGQEREIFEWGEVKRGSY